MSFADLKRSSSNSFDKLTKELEKLNKGSFNSDEEKYWYPGIDKVGNGYAVVRFLPAPNNEDVPFVRIWDHGFQGPSGLWYIENSLTTLNKEDPVSEYNNKLWNSGIESDKEIARKQKRRLTYVSNIYVIKDPNNPANEGKVFLFRYGKKIFDKINDMMFPQFEDEPKVNPFDLWKGANFKLKIRKVEGYRNYDKSEFDPPAPLFDEDDKLEEVWNKEHSLKSLVDPKNFKSYAELKARLDLVLGVDGVAQPRTSRAEDSFEEQAAPAPSFKAKEAPAAPQSSTEDDDEDLEFFKKLANED
jgi:hypothetical protein